MNSFDLLRLLAAVAVIFHHTAPLTGHPVQRLFSTDFGELGVGVFFVISGYLVTASWRRAPDLWAFLKKRLLRIEPALVVSLAVTALVLGARVVFGTPSAPGAGTFLDRERVTHLLVATDPVDGTDLGGYLPFTTDVAAIRADPRFRLVREFDGGRLLLFEIIGG